MMRPVYLLDWHLVPPAVAASTQYTHVVRFTLNLLRLPFGVNTGLGIVGGGAKEPHEKKLRRGANRYCHVDERRSL